MSRIHRIVAVFVVFAAAMFAFSSPASAALPSRSVPSSTARPPTFSGSSRLSAPPKVITYKNGTTVTFHNGMRFIQPHGRHAQPMVQRRDAKGRWMKAEPAKTWAPRISGFVIGQSRLGAK